MKVKNKIHSCLLAIFLLCFGGCVQAGAILTNLMDPSTEAAVSGSTKVDLVADFGGTFSSIDFLVFSFYFDGDVFDSGEEFMFGEFMTSPSNGVAFGAINIHSYSVNSRVLSLAEYHTATSLFFDGYQEFQFWMNDGSVNLVGATLEAIGDFTPSAAVPAPSAYALIMSGLIFLLFYRMKSK